MPVWTTRLLESVPTEVFGLRSLEAARAEAILRIRALLNAEADQGPQNLARSVAITDEAGNVLDVVRFADAVAAPSDERERTKIVSG